MNIKKISEEGKLTLEIEGRIDTLTAPELDGVIKSSLDGLKELILEIAQVDYISSAGLRVLISAQKKMNKQGKMEVRSANQDVIEIFEATGFDEILNIV
jgi:anti-sigma B factor antagonist